MIVSGKQFMEGLRASFPEATVHSNFPFLRVRIRSPHFNSLSNSEREAFVAKSILIDVPTLRKQTDRLFVRLDLIAETDDSTVTHSRGHTWLGMFADAGAVTPARAGVVHFYGFKGGQGRSTLLAFLANELARDGRRVLVVDLDAEAPTLDLVFGLGEIPPESTIVGLRAGLEISPVTVSTQRSNGVVELIAFRPSSEEYDLDAAALALEGSVNAPIHDTLANSLWELFGKKYDTILIDHRTGLGPTVPSWVRTVPGPLVVMDRLDGQSKRAVRDIQRIWATLPNPGLLVSYVPANSPTEASRSQRRGEAWRWLEALAGAKSTNAEQPLAAEDIEDHWVLFHDDNAFRRGTIPQRDEVGGLTHDCVARVREILELQGVSAHADAAALHPSGAQDQGLLIVTDALRELRQLGSPIRFVFGRKGTGKTRLLHELAASHVGQPLVVAEDEESGGFAAHDTTLRRLVDVAERVHDYEGLWWTLIGAALENTDTRTESLRTILSAGAPFVDGSAIEGRLRNSSSTGARVFLIDGLETMTQNREQAFRNVQALFNVCSSLEKNRAFGGRLSLRIFLRTDIARWGFENFEQQSHGKVLELRWSTQTILNFVLSRLPHLRWIASTFSDVMTDIRQKENEIQQGSLTEDECFSLLLRIFPVKLGRLNLNTTTFLRTYFSDDPSGLQSYYPRVYDKFLERINESESELVDGRISQDTIVSAHDDASRDFLTQVRQELRYIVSLDPQELERFIATLREKRTPFVRAALANEIRNSLKIKKYRIDETLEAMKDIGVFEQHPNRADQWRVGRLFKAALRMKYGAARNHE